MSVENTFFPSKQQFLDIPKVYMCFDIYIFAQSPFVKVNPIIFRSLGRGDGLVGGPQRLEWCAEKPALYPVCRWGHSVALRLLSLSPRSANSWNPDAPAHAVGSHDRCVPLQTPKSGGCIAPRQLFLIFLYLWFPAIIADQVIGGIRIFFTRLWTHWVVKWDPLICIETNRWDAWFRV